MEKFFAQFGDISTTTPWKRPTMVSVSDWWKEWYYTVGVEDYKVYLVGSFAEKLFGVYSGQIWDVDILLMGDIKNPKGLKTIMDEAIRIGFQKQLLVDIMWSSHIVDPYEFKPYSMVRNAKSFVKKLSDDVEQKTFYGDEEYTLDDGLIQYVYYDMPPMHRKNLHRRDNAEYLGTIVDLKDFFN